ncbi:kelch-like protein 10 [Stegodyphus dumicola]|uniref:kelch-like protein 10 n=1 Tax=Stegodyphus dumicola TaxID=202533 RepID=UPI0015AC4167|nr:kelch-like protein 10 [Stegodyphus dumicola]
MGKQRSSSKSRGVLKRGEFDRFPYLCDAWIETDDGKKFAVHRTLLSRISPYFLTVFTTTGCRRRFSTCHISGVSAEVMEIIIKYATDYKVQIDEAIVQDLMFASEYFLVQGLVSKCCNYVRSHISMYNCVAFYEISSWLEHLGLNEECFRFVVTHFEKVVQEHSECLSKLRMEDIETILKSDDLNVSDEWTVWKATEIWALSNPQERLQQVARLLPYLRLNLSDLSKIADHAIMKSNETFKHISSSNVSKRRPLPPKKCYVIFDCEKENCSCFITYDEKLDFQRKVSSFLFRPVDVDRGPGLSVYLFMGWECWLFDVVQARLIPLPNFRTTRLDCAIASVAGRLYVIGGNFYLPRYTKFRIVECYDPVTNMWQYVASTANPCRGDAAVLRGKIYTFGAYFDPFLQQEVSIGEVYDPLTNTWTLLPPTVNFSEVIAVLALCNKIYVAGRFKRVIVVVRYNPNLNKWNKRLKNLPNKFTKPKAVVLKETIVVYEGAIEVKKPKSFVWKKDLEEWEEVKDPIYKRLRHSHICCFDNKRILKLLRNRTSFEWEKIR